MSGYSCIIFIASVDDAVLDSVDSVVMEKGVDVKRTRKGNSWSFFWENSLFQINVSKVNVYDLIEYTLDATFDIKLEMVIKVVITSFVSRNKNIELMDWLIKEIKGRCKVVYVTPFANW